MPARLRISLVQIAACAALCLGATGLLAASAMAQSASDAVYGSPRVVENVTLGKAQPTAGPTTTQPGSLPFTGFAVGVLGGAGLLLVGLGWTARRVSHRSG